MLAPTLPDLSKLDREALQALVLAEHQERIATHQQLLRRESEIEHLKLLLRQLRRMQFGPKSEKLERQIEQLELRLEDLQQAQAAEEMTYSVERPSTEPSQPTVKAKPTRRPLPEHLPRQTQTHVPKHSVCPDCGGELRKLSEDVSEILEYVRACFQVIRHVRPKLSCQHCERIVQAAAPSRPIARGLAGPGLLAHVLVSKYADHLPLYRQCEIFERHGIELERSTLADWVGGTSALLDPLVEALRRYVMAADKLHADDTRASISYIKMIGFRRWRAGRTCDASSMTWNKPMPRLWPGKLWTGSQLCMRSRMRFVDGHRRNDNKFAKHELDPCCSPCTTGSKSH